MIKIAHLFPDLMNLYGDYGNLVVLKKHLEDQDLVVEIDRLNLGASIDFDSYDMVYMGS